MSGMPAPMPPPDGDQNRASIINGLNWTYAAICIVIVAMRVYVRASKRTIGADDYLMLIALGFLIATMAVIQKITDYGLGRHIFYVPMQNYVPFQKWIFILQSFTFFTLAFAKASVSIFLMRLAGPSLTWRKRILWANLVFFSILTCLSTIFNLISCKPIEASWLGQQNVPGAKCWALSVNADWAIFISSYSSFLDFFLALLPITIIKDLQLSTTKKAALCFVLGLGVLSGVAAAVKTAYSQTLAERADFSWDAFDVYCWSSAEFFLNIFCGSVVTLKPLYDQWFEGKPMTPVNYGTYGGSRKPLFGSSRAFDRFKLRNFSKGTSSTKIEGSNNWTVNSVEPKSITVQRSFDVDNRSQESTTPMRHGRDMV